MSNQFFQRVANYVANEIIVKGLANSKSFQRFAIRTNKQYENVAKQGVDSISKTFDTMAKQEAGGKTVASRIDGPPRPPLTGIPGFFLAVFKEARKDITGI